MKHFNPTLSPHLNIELTSLSGFVAVIVSWLYVPTVEGLGLCFLVIPRLDYVFFTLLYFSLCLVINVEYPQGGNAPVLPFLSLSEL